MHTHIHTYKHTYIQTYVYTYIHVFDAVCEMARLQEPEENANASPGTGLQSFQWGPEAATPASLLANDSVHQDNRSDISQATTLSIPPRLTLKSTTKVHPVHIPDTSTQQEYIPNTSDEDIQGTVATDKGSYDDRMTDNASVLAGGEDDQDISQEQLQMIKARTMFQMTEEIDDGGGGGRKRLLFLTNTQAELLSGSSASIQKMLDALEIPKPKLGNTKKCRICSNSVMI